MLIGRRCSLGRFYLDDLLCAGPTFSGLSGAFLSILGRSGTGTTRGDALVEVGLSNGKSIQVDLSDYIDAPGYERLSEPAVFSRARVEEWGHGIEWPEIGQGVSADTLIRLAREQAGEAFPVVAFNDWMCRNELSLTDAARALGVTRRTIVYWHGGHRPIPRYIGLACVGWESVERRGVA